MKLRRFGLLVSALVLSAAFSLRRCTAVLLWMLRGRWSAPAESGMSHLVNQREVRQFCHRSENGNSPMN